MRRTNVALAVLLLVVPMMANADPITIDVTGASDPSDDGEWVITTVVGDFASLEETLESQPYWDDEALATIFADLVRYDLGTQPLFPDLGVYFAFGFVPQLGRPLICTWDTSDTVCGLVGAEDRVYAIASRTAVSEPGLLALLGIGLASIGLVRRRRKASFA